MSDMCHNCGDCHLGVRPTPCREDLRICEVCLNYGHQGIFCPKSIRQLDANFQYFMLCHNCDKWHLPLPCNFDLVTCARCLNNGHLAAFCPKSPSARPYHPSHGPQANHVSQIDAELLRTIKRQICADTLSMVGTYDNDSIITIISAPTLPPPQSVVGPTISASYVQSTPSEVASFGGLPNSSQQDFSGNPLLVAAYGESAAYGQSMPSHGSKRKPISEDHGSSFPSTLTPMPARASVGRLFDLGFVGGGSSSSHYQAMHEKSQRGDFAKVDNAPAAAPEATPGASLDATSGASLNATSTDALDVGQDTKPDISSETAGDTSKATGKKKRKAAEPKKKGKVAEPKAKVTDPKAKVTKPKVTRRGLVHSPCADCTKRHKRCPKHKVKIENLDTNSNNAFAPPQPDEDSTNMPGTSEEVGEAAIETGPTVKMEEQDKMGEQDKMEQQDSAVEALSASHSSSVEIGSPGGSNAATEPFTAEEEAALRAAIASMPPMAIYEMAGWNDAHITGFHDASQFVGNDQAGMAALASAAEMHSSNMLPPNMDAGNTDFYQPRPSDFQGYGYTSLDQAIGTQLQPSQFNFLPMDNTSFQESQSFTADTGYYPVDPQHMVPFNDYTVNNDYNFAANDGVGASVEEPDAGTGFTEGEITGADGETVEAEDGSMED